MRCRLYAYTGDGERCVLVPPEEWKVIKSKSQQYCTNEGRGCPLLANYYKMIERRM